jgi:hypothetical protein
VSWTRQEGKVQTSEKRAQCWGRLWCQLAAVYYKLQNKKLALMTPKASDQFSWVLLDPCFLPAPNLYWTECLLFPQITILLFTCTQAGVISLICTRNSTGSLPWLCRLLLQVSSDATILSNHNHLRIFSPLLHNVPVITIHLCLYLNSPRAVTMSY